MRRVCTSLVLQSRDPKVLLDRHFSFPRSMLPASSVSDVFARIMWTLSIFASLTKIFQLASSVHAVDKTASSSSRSSSAKSTSSAYSHSSGMPRVEMSGLGLVVSV